uniref:Uncharacterized protein n=1 Tax=viral metagenome TaxID=1070528 RepID=A0A6C0HVN4_9ZZZZ
MENICYPNKLFDFSDITLAHPTSIQGGAYFTKILQKNKPLYIEAPKCLTKQGFVKNGKKMYTELMFNINDEEFIHWIENLEVKCQKLIYDKSDVWFQNKLEMNDIESAFTSPLRIYKSGKFYLMRVNVKMNYSTNNPHIKIYNENETALTIDDVNVETNVISIMEVQGIKFTSRNFQIELELKQLMVLNTDIIFDSCLIKTTGNNNKIQAIDNNVFMKIQEEQMLEEPMLEEPMLEEEPTKTLENTLSSLSLLEKLSDSIINEETQKPTIPFIIDVSANNPSPSPPIDDLNIEELSQDNLNELCEFDINTNLNSLETITLKKPNQVYYEIYKEARKKAKSAKREAIVAFLEAKNIKKTYMLDDLDESDSDDSDLDNISNSDAESETEELENN